MSRTITGKLIHFVNNEPLPSTPITFRLKTDVATEPGEAYPIGESTIITDANGDLPAGFALAVPPTGAWRYSCKISGNRGFDFYLEAGAAMTIDQIIALAGFAGTEPSPIFVPSAHASTHASGGSDPLTPADIGAEVAGTTATHAALEGTAVHGLGTAALLTSTDVGEDLVTAVDVDGAREVLGLAAVTMPRTQINHSLIGTWILTDVLGGATASATNVTLAFLADTTATASARARLRTGSNGVYLSASRNGINWTKQVVWSMNIRFSAAASDGVTRWFLGKISSSAFGIIAVGDYICLEENAGTLNNMILCRAGTTATVALTSTSLTPAGGVTITVVAENGNASVYANGVLIGSSSLAPNNAIGQGAASFEINNGVSGERHFCAFTSQSEI